MDRRTNLRKVTWSPIDEVVLSICCTAALTVITLRHKTRYTVHKRNIRVNDKLL